MPRCSEAWARLVVVLGLGVSASACGRSPFGVGLADGGADGDTTTAPTFDTDGDAESEPADRDEPLTPDESGCGDGYAAPGEVCFLPQRTFPSRIDPCAISIADLDGDGHMDVAVPNSDFDHLEAPDNYASVLYGDGRGALSEPYALLAGGDFAVGIRIADLDGDGRPDLVVSNNDAAELNALLADGPRSFAPALRTPAGQGTVTTALGDLDGDGILDTVITSEADVRVARGRGDGTFDPAVVIGTDLVNPWEPALADLDGDGDPDILATDAGGSRVARWRNDGAAGFVRLDDLGVGIGVTDVTPADLDDDGDLDLLVVSTLATHVWMGDGAGALERREDVVAGYESRAVAIADFDSDGILDAAILAQGSENVTIAVGDGQGGFALVAEYDVGTLPSGIEAGDFNEDGVSDLAISNQLDNDVGLILSNP
jgi:hypothetical protein